MPNQGKIINVVNLCLKKKGNIDFILNKKGICAGLAALYIKYALGNTKSNLESRTAPFFHLLDKLANLPSTYGIGDNPIIDNFIIKIEKSFRADEYSYYEILQSDVEKILDIGNKPLKNEFNLGLVTAEAHWKEIFKKIARNDRSYSIFSNNHAISLSIENGKFIVYDPNYNRKKKEFETIDDLIKEIKDCFEYKEDSFGLGIRAFAHPDATPEHYPSHDELHQIAFTTQIDTNSSSFAAIANDNATLELLFKQNKISYDKLAKEYFRPEFNNLLMQQPKSPLLKKAVLRGIRCTLYVGNLNEAEKLIDHYLKTYDTLEDQEELKNELQLLLDESVKIIHLLMKREADYTRLLKLFTQLNLTQLPKNQTIYNHLQLLTFVKQDVDSSTRDLFLSQLSPEQIIKQIQCAAIANQHHVLHLLLQQLVKAKIPPKSYPSIFNQELIQKINVTALKKLLEHGFMVNLQDPDLLGQCMERNDKTIFETYAQAWLTQSHSTLWEHIEKREYDLIDLSTPLGSITLLNALIFLRKNEHVKKAWRDNIPVEMIKSALTIAILNGNKEMSLFLQEKLQSKKAKLEQDTLEFLYKTALEEDDLPVLDILTQLNFNVLHKTDDIRALFILCSDYEDYSIIKTCLATASPKMKQLILESSLNWNIAPVIEICAEKEPKLFNDYLNTYATNPRNLAKLNRVIPNIPRVTFSLNTNPQEQKKQIKDLFKNKLPSLAKSMFRTVKWEERKEKTEETEKSELEEFLDELIKDKNENGIKLLLQLEPKLKQSKNLIAQLANNNLLIALGSLFEKATIIFNQEIPEQISVLANNDKSSVAQFMKKGGVTPETPKEGITSETHQEGKTPQSPQEDTEQLIEKLQNTIKQGQDIVLEPYVLILSQELTKKIFTSALANNNKMLVTKLLEQGKVTPKTSLEKPLKESLKEAIEKGHDSVLEPFIESNLDFGLDFKELFLFSCEKKQAKIANLLLAKEFVLSTIERKSAIQQLFGDQPTPALFDTIYEQGYGRFYQLLLKTKLHNPRASLLNSIQNPEQDPSIQNSTLYPNLLQRAVKEKNKKIFDTLFTQSKLPDAPDKSILDALKDPILFASVFPLFEKKYSLQKLLTEALQQEEWATLANLIEHKKLTDFDLELQKPIQDHGKDIIDAHLQNLEAHYHKIDVRPRLFKLLEGNNPHFLKTLAAPYKAKIEEALERIELKMLKEQLDLNNQIYRYTFESLPFQKALEELAKIFEECQKIISDQKIDLDQTVENPELVNHLAQMKIIMAGKDISPDYLSETHYALLEQLLGNPRFKEVCQLEFKLHCLLRQFQKPLSEQNEAVSTEFYATIKLLREQLAQANLPESFVLPEIQCFLQPLTKLVSPEPEMKDNASLPSEYDLEVTDKSTLPSEHGSSKVTDKSTLPSEHGSSEVTDKSTLPSEHGSSEVPDKATLSSEQGSSDTMDKTSFHSEPEKKHKSLPPKTVSKKSNLDTSNLAQLKKSGTDAVRYYLGHRDQTLSYFSYFFDYYRGQIRATHYHNLINSAQTEQELNIIEYAILVNDDTNQLKKDLMFKLHLPNEKTAEANLKAVIRKSFTEAELPHIDALIDSINRKANGSERQATRDLFKDELDYLKQIGRPQNQSPMKNYSFFNSPKQMVGFWQWIVSWLINDSSSTHEHKLSTVK